MQTSHAIESQKPTASAVTSAAPDRFIADVEAAALLGLSRGYLRQLRVRGGGPVYVAIGRAVRYRLPALMAWADSKSVASTSQYATVN